MMPQMLNENDMEQMNRMPVNLQLVILYTYPNEFILQSNPSNKTIRNNLTIPRKPNPKIKEIDKEKAIEEGFTTKHQFTAFMGLLKVLSETYLFMVQSCEKICSIQGHDIFQLREVALINCGQEATGQQKTQIDSYVLFLKNYLLKEGYYFSYDYDLSLSRQAYAQGYQTRHAFYWNVNMSEQLLHLQDKGWFVGLMQGSVRYFKVFIQGRKLEYVLITRRSWKMGGTRYNSRGIDSKGKTANFCETEQIIILGGYLFSHVGIRGSVPAFWKQSGIYAQVQFYGNHEDSRAAFQKHFKQLEKIYGNIFCINLLSKTKSGESSLTSYYQFLIKELDLSFLKYEFYDFHFACKGQKFERSDYLIQKLGPVNNYFSYYSQNLTEKIVMTQQKGVFRTNCIDCLDRTGVIQTKLANYMFSNILVKCGFNLQTILGNQSILKAARGMETSNMFIINLKNAWADNGDSISKHYTGTGSTHTNVTRTGRRDLKGIMDHGLKTLGRFYKQYMEDNYKQQVIDLLVGLHTPTINLAQFQSRLKNAKEEQIESLDIVQM